MLVQEFLEDAARKYPDKTALVSEGQRLTYAEIDAKANRLANALIEKGIRRGDRVILYLPNGVDLVISIFAALKAGGVFVVINPSTKLPKLLYILNDSQASVLFLPASQSAVLSTLAEQAPSVRTVFLSGSLPADDAALNALTLQQALDAYPGRRPLPCTIDLDLACLVYTSGSTGEPKGVMSDHGNVVFACDSIITFLQNTPDDIVIDFLPLSFDYGLYQMLMVFRFGGTLVLERGFLFPSAVLKKITQEKVTGFPGVPTIFAVLLQMDLSGCDLSSLRYITNTAAALPVSMIQKIRDLFPAARLYSMYGLTETKRTLYLPPEELDQRPASVGIAIPGTEVWLEDETGRRLAHGSTGELVVRGRHVMRGYWNAPELSAQRYRPGEIPGERVCLSGDIFRSDPQGFYYFVARKDDIIKCKGEKVSPVEIERVLYEIEGVVESAVIGVSDPVFGQAIKVFVVVNDSALDEAAILRHCRARLEDFMIPKYVEFRSELPKSPSGKIDKKGLA
jgi:long-chain acyl-CoA synthetase